MNIDIGDLAIYSKDYYDQKLKKLTNQFNNINKEIKDLDKKFQVFEQELKDKEKLLEERIQEKSPKEKETIRLYFRVFCQTMVKRYQTDQCLSMGIKVEPFKISDIFIKTECLTSVLKYFCKGVISIVEAFPGFGVVGKVLEAGFDFFLAEVKKNEASKLVQLFSTPADFYYHTKECAYEETTSLFNLNNKNDNTDALIKGLEDKEMKKREDLIKSLKDEGERERTNSIFQTIDESLMRKFKKILKNSFLFEDNSRNRFAIKFACSDAKKKLTDLIKNPKNIKKKMEELKENESNKEIAKENPSTSQNTAMTEKKKMEGKPDNCLRKLCRCCCPWKKNSIVNSEEEKKKLMENTDSESKRETN